MHQALRPAWPCSVSLTVAYVYCVRLRADQPMALSLILQLSGY